MTKQSALEDVLPLTPLQEGMFFHSWYDDEAVDVYGVQMVLALDGPLRPDLLRASVAALLKRHPNLRAGFRQRANGQPFQVIHREVPLPWEELDLGAGDGDEAGDEAGAGAGDGEAADAPSGWRSSSPPTAPAASRSTARR